MPATSRHSTDLLTLIAANTALTNSYVYSEYFNTIGLLNGAILITCDTQGITSLEIRFDEKHTSQTNGFAITASDLDTTTGIETLAEHYITVTKAVIDSAQTKSGGGFSVRVPIVCDQFRVGVKCTGTTTNATVKIEAQYVE